MLNNVDMLLMMHMNKLDGWMDGTLPMMDVFQKRRITGLDEYQEFYRQCPVWPDSHSLTTLLVVQ